MAANGVSPSHMRASSCIARPTEGAMDPSASCHNATSTAHVPTPPASACSHAVQQMSCPLRRAAPPLAALLDRAGGAAAWNGMEWNGCSHSPLCWQLPHLALHPAAALRANKAPLSPPVQNARMPVLQRSGAAAAGSAVGASWSPLPQPVRVALAACHLQAPADAL